MRRSLSGALNRVNSLANHFSRQSDIVDWDQLVERLQSVRQEEPLSTTQFDDARLEALWASVRELRSTARRQ
jgi:hypothetical protein